MPQDMPPMGGYEAVQYKRNIPTRGPRPIFYMLGVIGVMAYGWRKLFVGNREKHELAREKMWSRIYLTPLLQAEEDRDQVRRWYADQAREQKYFGSQSSFMNSDRFVRPTYAASRGYETEKEFEAHTAEKYRQIEELDEMLAKVKREHSEKLNSKTTPTENKQ